MPNLSAFKKGVRECGKTLFPKVVKREQADLFGRVCSGILLATPVLTSHARHNWMPQLNEPLLEELEGVAGIDYTGEPFTGAEVAKIERVQNEIMESELGQTAYLSNNAPYIELLEDGWSQKAPAGMCELTIHSVLEHAQSQNVDLAE